MAQRLGSNGKLYLQEISPSLIKIAVKATSAIHFRRIFLANGSYLPFPDNFFDAAHHFGGINTFSEITRCLSELARVVKPGGKVVIGDEGLAPWLRDTEMGRIMTNSNPLLKCEPPLQSLPATATEVQLEYIMMGAFYVIEFRVAAAPPQPDYHMQIPSARGGSHWTRYYGQLEGVSDEAKRLAHEARAKAGLSMHDWLERWFARLPTTNCTTNPDEATYYFLAKARPDFCLCRSASLDDEPQPESLRPGTGRPHPCLLYLPP